MTTSLDEIRPITDPLRQVRRKLRLVAVGSGLVHLLWTSLAMVIAAGICDYVIHLPGPVRLAVVLAIGAYVIYGVVAWVIRPLISKIPLDVMAAEVEKHNPWLQDRLRSSLVFADDGAGGAQALRRRVVDEALASADRVDFSQVVDAHDLRSGLLIIIAPVLLGLLLAWWQPALFRIGVDRLVAPFSNVAWPKQVQIQLVNALPERVPAGHRLELSAKLNRGDRASRQVVVSWQIGDGQVQRQLMQRGDDGVYTAGVDVRATSEASDQQMRLWIEAGDDVIGPAVVSVVPRLQVASVTLEVTPPAYTNLKAASFNLRLQPASVPADSELKLTLGFNRSVRMARIEAVGSTDSTIPEVAWEKQNASGYVGKWQATQSSRFRVSAEDEYGYTNSSAEEYELIVRPDQQPVIQLESPRRSEERTAEATVPLLASIEDDYGVNQVTIEARHIPVGAATTQPANPSVLPLIDASKPATESAVVEAADSEAQRVRSRLKYPWKLVTFPSAILKPGDVIEFQLTATDTYLMNGQTHPAVRTPPLRISIVSQEQLLQRVYDELRQVATQVSDVKIRQDRLRSDTEQLRQDTKDKEKPDEADRAVASRIAEQETRAASQVGELSERLGATAAKLEENASPSKDLGTAVKATEKLLDRASQESMRPAAGNVKQAGDENQSRQQREESLKSASQSQKKASEQLSAALDTLGDVGGLRRAIDMVQELLTRQRGTTDKTADFGKRNPGVSPEKLAAKDRKELENLVRDQRDLSKQTDEAVDQLREMAKRQGADDRSSAEAMKQAAQTAQETSVSQHQNRASQSISQNQSSQAGGSQASAEAGLQQMLDSLRDAQKRKLEELVRRLATMQQQLMVLVARQAGHNLDNMMLRKVDNAALREELVAKANRKDPAAASQTREQLAASQQQTHQNTADLIEQLAKLPTGEASSLVSRAAGRMERAIVLIRQEKLEDAFAPPQTEALAALEDALKEVRKSAEEAQNQREKDKQAEVRKAYEALRDQQVQVQQATKTLDQSMAEAKRRSDAVRLKQLATDQEKLAEDSKPLAEKLDELGSSIFTRAGRRISTDMTSIAEELAAQKTGRPVQLGQTRIISQINAIIHALTPPDPDDQKYADRPSAASGQGQQQRKLPSAAELQLIRDLQAAVNDLTRQIGDDAGELAPPVGKEQAGVREAFDELIEQAMKGAEMPDEKASREKVPEEEPNAEVAVDPLDEELLIGDPAAAGKEGPDIRMAARRMTRSGVRLSEEQDPGKVTQAVQERILITLDKLVDQARRQQRQASSSSSSSSSQQAKADPNAQPGETGNSTGSEAAAKSEVRPGSKPPEPTGDIRETAKDWGGISQRDRQAIIESSGENILEKYRQLTEEYYRALSNKATENR